MIENFEIIDFIGSNSSIKSHQQWFKLRLSSFNVEIHDLHPENEWDETGFHNPM